MGSSAVSRELMHPRQPHPARAHSPHPPAMPLFSLPCPCPAVPVQEILAEMGGKPDFIIGNYSDVGAGLHMGRGGWRLEWAAVHHRVRVCVCG